MLLGVGTIRKLPGFQIQMTDTLEFGVAVISYFGVAQFASGRASRYRWPILWNCEWRSYAAWGWRDPKSAARLNTDDRYSGIPRNCHMLPGGGMIRKLPGVQIPMTETLEFRVAVIYSLSLARSGSCRAAKYG